MFRLKSHLWPPCTLCRLRESIKKLVKYVRGRGSAAPGGAPDGRCPKCRTVAHRLHSGAHFDRWFLFTFVHSSAKSKKMKSPKGVKRGNPVKYELSRKVAFRQKHAFRESQGEPRNIGRIRHFRDSRRDPRKARKTRTFSKRKEEKLCLSSRKAS